MSYTPTEWKTGDVVTSAKLNKLEQGVADSSGVLVVTVTDASDGENKVCDKTAGEMAAALENGGIIFRTTVLSEDGAGGYQYTPLLSAMGADDETYYSFITGFDTVMLSFTATSASEYPVSGQDPK